MDIILFSYGLAFFSLALVILAQPREESRHELAKIVWLLVVFGFSHGLLEWLTLRARVQGHGPVHEAAGVLLLFISFLSLFEFGRRLLLAAAPPQVVRTLLGRRLYALAALGFIVEFVLIPDRALAAKVGTRYFLGFTGASMTAAGFLLYYREHIRARAHNFGLDWAKKYFTLAGAAFALYAVASGLMVPAAPTFPASLLNQEWFHVTFGLPVEVLRTLAAVLAVIAIGNILRLFHLEAREKLKGSTALAAAQRISRTGSWEWDVRANSFHWSDETYLMFGIEPDTARERGGEAFGSIHPDDRSRTGRALVEALAGTGPYDLEYRIILPDGATKTIHALAEVTRDDGGRPLLVRGTLQDITARKQMEESMRLAAQIYQSSAEAVMVTDEHNRIMDVNPAFTQLCGYTLDEVAGKQPDLLRSGHHDDAFYEEMLQTVRSSGRWHGELWMRSKDGSVNVNLANYSVLRNPDGSVYRHVAQFFDVTAQKQKEETIWMQANFDQLTGLPNRRLFHDRLDQEIKKTRRTGASLALLFIDLDRFKSVNDTLGHAQGDRLLAEAARRIGACVRDTDTVARLGGDEFTLILPEFGERMHLEQVAQRVNQSLSRPFELGSGETGYISASIGIALYPDDARGADDLMRHADQAMYAAKAAGRNRFNYFISSMQQEALEKLQLSNDLRQALVRKELEVHYQPIVDAATGAITKAEALLRWKHPKHGWVSPATFVPLAEESGLILEIGDWVFHEVIGCVERCFRQFGRAIQVSVNMSPLQLEQAERHTWLDRFKSAGLPENSITVEITEGMLVKDSDKVRQRLIEFRNRGIEASIDDFGTGFSALSYLTRFDIDYLKIDRSFVSHLTGNVSDRALTEAIIAMAHKLSIRTIAEGVETEGQRDLLLSFGCDYLQGYLYSRPVAAEEFGRLLEEWRPLDPTAGR